MDESPSDYHHGEMSVADQSRTYAMFGRLAKWGSLHIAVLLTLFTLWFCTGAGFVGGLIPALVVWAAGVFFLRSKPTAEH